MTHTYVTQNGKVMRETIGTGATAKVLDFIYDNSGKPFALRYSTNGGSSYATYYYVLNLQGDVVKLVRIYAGTTIQEYEEMASYTYNAWGEIISSSGSMADINPLRYRGYYYDTETGFYYLQSRYYDPANHRFINADCYTSTGQGFLGYDMYVYCNNHPVMFADYRGSFPTLTISGIFDELIEKIEERRRQANEDFLPINGQSVCEYANMEFGWLSVSTNGCAAIAIYNALGFTGQAVYFSDVIKQLDSWHRPRFFGVMPGEIGNCLANFGASFTEADSISELELLMENGGVAIVTRWNRTSVRSLTMLYPILYESVDVSGGAHTMAVVHDGNGNYTVYNRYSNKPISYPYDSLEEFIGSEVRYVAGFYLG